MSMKIVKEYCNANMFVTKVKYQIAKQLNTAVFSKQVTTDVLWLLQNLERMYIYILFVI